MFGVLTPLLVFGALSWVVVMRESVAWDFRLARFLYETSSDHRLLQAGEQLGVRLGEARTIAVTVLCALLVLLWTRRLHGAVFLLTAMSVVVLDSLLSQAFRRSLPFEEQGASFPSGHATGSMAAVAAVVILLAPTRWRWPSAAMGALLVGFIGVAVVSDGGHWPSDVVAGWCLSLAWVSVAWLVVSRIHRHNRRSRVARPGSHQG